MDKAIDQIEAYPLRKHMDNASLIQRAVVDMLELERRLGKGGEVTRILDALLQLPERRPEKPPHKGTP